jgi:two-component SAPR family response regulator
MGDEDAADAAADLALDAARRQGSNHHLLQGLAEFPAVASRRIDAEPAADSPWHEIGRALRAQDVTLATSVRSSVELREFGARLLLVDGEEQRPRIGKAIELLALLATRQPDAVARDELLEALFDGVDTASTRSYLRQATHWLRQSLPEGSVIAERSTVGLSPDLAITTESLRFERDLAEAARLQGTDRLDATVSALSAYDRGEYLPGRRSAWSDEREAQLASVASDARYETAELAFAAGDYALAAALARKVLEAESFHEAAWRLTLRVANTLGDEKAVIQAFRDCERSLATVGVQPSPTTRELLDHLRR